VRRWVAAVIAVLLTSAAAGWAADRSWENPVFAAPDEAVAAAKRNLERLDRDAPASLRLFVDLTLAEGDVGGRHPSAAVTRDLVDRFLVTHPTSFLGNRVQRRTIERFRREMPRQTAIVERRLARFGYAELEGLVYCRLVDSVDAFSGLGKPSSDKMTQIGGVTYYCRYLVLPLSYVGEENLRQLRRSAATNPSLDVNATVNRWQRESYANLVSTFRHELVHVHTNSTLDVPAYSDRTAYPTWFHEGTATYLAADPHSGLSEAYQEFQELFFFLVQRYGVRDLQNFYAGVLGGNDVASVLADVYSIAGAEQLFTRSSRWHRTKDVVRNLFWIGALAVVITAFRGSDRPHIGILLLMFGAALGLAVATGLAEHLYGLRGPGVVLAAKIGFAGLAAAIAGLGVRRILRHRRLRVLAD
jgi:hypothetical protein